MCTVDYLSTTCMGTSTICLRSIKSSLPFCLPLRHSRDKLFQALSHFSVLEATESSNNNDGLAFSNAGQYFKSECVGNNSIIKTTLSMSRGTWSNLPGSLPVFLHGEEPGYEAIYQWNNKKCAQFKTVSNVCGWHHLHLWYTLCLLWAAQ